MNAVLLKELRQSVRNRYVLAAYVIFIVVLLVVAGVQVSLFVQNSWNNPQSVFSSGKVLFMTIHGIFAALAIAFIPTYVMTRIIKERWGTNLDLMYVTPMPPSALLMGKFCSAMALAGLFLSGALPFLALSYFIGGIDVLSIVMTVILTLEIIALLTLYAIVVAIAPMPKIIRGLAQIGLVMHLVSAVWMWIAGSSALCSEGYTSILGNRDSCILLVELMAVGVSVGGLLYAAALAGFRSVNLDRMRPFRILATVLFAAWGVIAAIQSRYDFFEDTLKIWVCVLMLFSAGMLVLGLSERAESGAYLRKSLPRSLAWRVLGFPFRTGQFNAVCWALLLFVTGFALSYAIFTKTRDADFADGGRVFVLNISGYALTMLALWRGYLRFRRMPVASLWWVTGVAMLLVTAILGPLCAGGMDAIDYFVGYVFAERHDVVLPLLYCWNALALLCCVCCAIYCTYCGKMRCSR